MRRRRRARVCVLMRARQHKEAPTKKRWRRHDAGEKLHTDKPIKLPRVKDRPNKPNIHDLKCIQICPLVRPLCEE